MHGVDTKEAFDLFKNQKLGGKRKRFISGSLIEFGTGMGNRSYFKLKMNLGTALDDTRGQGSVILIFNQ